MPKFFTLSQIATKFGRKNHQIEYVIHSRGIQPCDQAGSANLYDEAAVTQIETTLRAMTNRSGGVAYRDRRASTRETAVAMPVETR
jgi:hypothetical protein